MEILTFNLQEMVCTEL